MVRSRTSTAKSRLHESISAFVPLFLSSRSASALPRPPKTLDLNDKVTYIGSAPQFCVPSAEQSNLYDAGSEVACRDTRPSTGSKHRGMDPHQLSRTHTSSSLGSSSATSKNLRHHRPQYTTARSSRPSPSRTTSSSKAHPSSRSSARARPRRRMTAFTRLRLAVESKFRLTLAFGLGSISALVIYLGLFLSHTSRGTAFHVLSILLLVALFAVATHSLFRFLALNTELKAVRAHRAGLKKTPSARGWNISRPLPQFTSSSSTIHDEKASSIDPAIGVGTAHRGYENDEFPVFDAAAAARSYNTEYEHDPYDHHDDLEANPGGAHNPIRMPHPPPPVYGNTRNSVRLSISAQHSSQQHGQRAPTMADPNTAAAALPPRPLAPGMPGWHPPSFRSEGGITAVLERRRMEVQDRLLHQQQQQQQQQQHGGGEEVLGSARYEPRGVGREGRRAGDGMF